MSALAHASERACIRALEDLLSEGVSHISLSAIARRAGVSRQTLYRHFPNIAEVRRGFARQVAMELIDEETGGAQDEIGVQERTSLYFEMLMRHRQALLGLRDKGLLAEFTFAFWDSYCDLYLKPVLGFDDLDSNMHLFFAGGLSALTDRWLDLDPTQSPEAMGKAGRDITISLVDLFFV